MRAGYVPVGAALAPYIDRIWSWEGPPERLPTVLPGTGAELVVHHGSPVVADTAAGPRRLPDVHLMCLRRTRWPLSATGPVAFTAIRIRAEALGRLCPVPVSAVVDEVVAATDVFGAAAVDRLIAAVCRGGALAERVDGIDAVLAGLLDAHHTPDPRIEAAVRRVYRDPDTVHIDGVGPGVGLSARHLRRGFLAAVGVAPKEFQQLARFQRVARALLLSAPEAHLATALRAGYYDQSHYIKQFRRFAGVRPSQLLDRHPTHFYHPSLTRQPTPVAAAVPRPVRPR